MGLHVVAHHSSPVCFNDTILNIERQGVFNMTKKTSFICIICNLLILTLMLCACSHEKIENGISNKVLVGSSFPESIEAILYYDTGPRMTKKSSFIFTGENVFTSETDFEMGYEHVFPVEALNRFFLLSGYDSEAVFLDEYGQPYAYKNFPDCEVFLFHNLSNDGNITLFINKDGLIKKIVLKQSARDPITSIRKDGNFLYLIHGSEETIKIYKVNIQTYNISNHQVTFENLKMNPFAIKMETTLVHNDIIYFTTEDWNDTFTEVSSKIIMFNLTTGVSTCVENKGTAYFQIFHDNSKLIVLGRELVKGDYRNINISLFDYELNSISEPKDISFSDIQFRSNYRDFCYFECGKVFGTLSGNTRDIHYIFVYDIEQKKVEFLSRLTILDKEISLGDIVFGTARENRIYNFNY